MNEFTKDELTNILGALKFIDSEPFIGCAYTWGDNLIDKIQSLIDNYDKPKEYYLPTDAKIGDTFTIPASPTGWIIK